MTATHPGIFSCVEAYQTLGEAALREGLAEEKTQELLRRLVLDLFAAKIALQRNLLPRDCVDLAKALYTGSADSWSDVAGVLSGLASRRNERIDWEEEARISIWPLNEFVGSATLREILALFHDIPGSVPVNVLGDSYQALCETPLQGTASELTAKVASGRKSLREKRQNRGLFYTPSEIVRRILALALPKPVKGSGAPYLCDPAMGAGHFLIAMAWRIAEGDFKTARRIAATRLFGVDLDPSAVRLCHLSLWLEFSSPLLPFSVPEHFIQGDALTGPGWNKPVVEQNLHLEDIMITPEDNPPSQSADSPVDWGASFPVIAARGGFDLVVGNPPYDVLTGFAKHPELKGYVQSLRSSNQYADALSGQLNLYRLFIERALALLCDGGKLSFIVPASFLTDKVAAPLRKKLLVEHALSHLEHFTESDKCFAGVGQSVMIFLAQKSGGRPDRVRMLASVGLRGKTRNLEQRLSLPLIATLDPESMPLPLAQPEDWKLVQWLSKNARARFGEIATGGVGEVDQTVFRRWLLEKGETLLVRGCHLSPFYIDQSRSPSRQRFLDLEGFLQQKGDSAEACREQARRERLVQLGIRNQESRPRLVAARLQDEAYLGNSVNWWLPREGVPMMLLVGLLNSSLYDWRFRLTSSNNNINIYEVSALPLPEVLLDYFQQNPKLPRRQRNRLAAQLFNLGRVVEAMERAAYLGRDILGMRIHLNEAVFEIFNLPQRYRKWINGTSGI
ncbi:MAG: Eco57I restriction-modification methylase domain-containing protein [Planctomycetes bacterium]|nr:Eco57I restriction-modification methylase domain-containing protein [Planctomycetota bacterium]